MKEVHKSNDIFVSTLLNPTADIPDLLANGVNGTNTGLLPVDTYKNSKFVQDAFSDENGVFNDEKFAQVYKHAEQKYNELQSVQLYSDLSAYAKFNENDIYAPIQSQRQDKTYEMKRVRNPFRVSEGVTSLFGKGESEYSNRELAQMHKVWDSENNKWLDYTAEEQGFLGMKYLGRKSLVYAAWDADGVHFDPVLGREVRHKKGEWKTDENGMFYTETIGNKQGYGKEFVAYSDILTKEDSWANNIDFFDSDDKKKSAVGVIAKTAAAILPYMIPGVREVWGGLTAAVSLAAVLPTFAKMAEGIIIGDGETGFTKAMSSIENYFNKFDDSHSDAGKQNMINFETIMGTIGDVYGQLYQMRAAASLSNLYNKQFSKIEADSYKNFAEKFGREWALATQANPKEFAKNPKAFQELWKTLADNTPEMKALVEKQSKLSKTLSLGYMAMTSSADVYEDAIQGGYDRRMAGLAGFLATAGQFGIMYNNKLGDWFLDATTGYKNDVSRQVMRKTLQPYYDKIAKASESLTSKIPTEEKVSILSKLYTGIFKNGPKKLKDILVYGGEELWKKGLIEGVEEVTEEAVMDATKGIFDTLSAMGIGKNAKTASFGGWDNVFSASGAQRYLMSFIGGTLGGSLFELQRSKIQPKIDAAIYGKPAPDVRYSLIQEIMNGNTSELMAEIDRMCAADTQSVILNDNNTQNPVTRGEVIANTLKQYVRFVEGVVADEGIKLSDLSGDALIKKVVRTKMLQPVIEESGLMDMIQADFTKMVDEFVALKAKEAEKVETEDDDKDKKKEKKDSKKDESGETEHSVSDTDQSILQEDIKAKKQQLVDFLNGKNEETYLKTALLYLHPALRYAALGVDKYSWTKAVYNTDYSSLPETEATLSKQQIDREYSEWKAKSDDLDKFRTIGVYAFDEMEKEFSPVFEEYANSMYSDVRKVTMDTLLRDSNFTIGTLVQKQDWRGSLIAIGNGLRAAGLKGISLEDILSIGQGTRDKIADSILHTTDEFASKVAEELTKVNQKNLQQWEALPDEVKETVEKPNDAVLSVQDVQNLFKEKINDRLQELPLEEITPQALNNIFLEAHHSFSEILAKTIFDTIGKDATIDQAKAAADELLINLGYSPITEPLTGDPMIAVSKYISLVTTPKTDITANINLVAYVLEEYLENNELIDDEVVRKIKKTFYTDIETISQDTIDLLREDDFEPISFDEVEAYFKFKDLKTVQPLLLTRVQEGLDNNEDIDIIVEDWLFGPYGVVDTESLSYQTFVQEIMPDADKVAIQTVSDRIKSLPSYKLYEIAKNKKSKSNPLFEKLRKFGMKVFDGKDLTIFELLEAESSHMAQLPSISEYIRQGITKEAIDNFISKLELIQAVIIGMEDTGLDPEHQIAYNVQMRNWNQKWEKGNADKYKTISTQNVIQIINDLDLLKNKLVFAQTLIETNTDSKRGEDKKIQKHIEEALLNVVEEAGELKIEGVSVLPPRDELEKKETTSEKIALIEHTLYSKVQELIKAGHSVDTVVAQVFEAFKINKNKILDSGLLSFGLTKEAAISPYDFFVWLTTAIAHDSYEFFDKYKTVLGKEEYKFVPFYVQEVGAKTLYSFASDEIGVHDAAVKWLYTDVPTTSTQEASRIFFLNGIAGAGKSTAVMSVVKAMLGKSAWVASPNKNQADKLAQSLAVLSNLEEGTPVYDKVELLSQILTDEGLNAVMKLSQTPNLEGGSIEAVSLSDGMHLFRANIKPEWIKQLDKENIPAYIFIDEATHFNLAELKALDEFAKKYNVKIISAGDTLQKGATIAGQSGNINEIFAWKSPAMTISVRSTNIHQKKNIETLQARLRKIEQIIIQSGYNLNNPEIQVLLSDLIQVDYYQNESDIQGNKIVDVIEEEDLKVIKQAIASGKTLAIISQVDTSGKILDSSLVAKLQSAGLTEADYKVYSPDDFSAYAVQGAEANYVIVNDMPAADMDNYQNMINFYTYLSRSLDGSIIKAGSYKDKLSLQSRRLPYTSDYSVPGLSEQAKYKQEKIDSINKILEGYTPPAKPATPSSTSTTGGGTSTPVTVEPTTAVEDLEDPEDQRKVRELIAIGEDETTKKLEPDAQFEANPLSWKPDSMYAYAFYNRTGVYKDRNGNHFSRSGNTSMDLDGLFGDKPVFINKQVIRGYIKFKNLVALYADNIQQLKEGLDDPDILAFFWRINPALSNAPDEQDRREEVKKWLQDNLEIDDTIYVFGKKYNSEVDASDMTVDSNPNAVKDGDLWMGYGRRVVCKDPAGKVWLNQFITTGALPKPETLNKWSIQAESYIALRAKAEKVIKDTGRLAIFKLPASARVEKATGLQVRKAEDKNKYITLRAMQDDYGIQFVKDVDKEPLIGLIDGTKKTTIDGITSFDFLHFIAQTEATSLGYAERIQQLEKAYVKNGKLTISGKYFAIGKFTAGSDTEYNRVLILEPDGWTYQDALNFQHDLSRQTWDEGTDRDQKGTILERKASAMSQASQMRILKAMFQTLGCIDENGMPIGAGVKPYVDRTLKFVESHFNGQLLLDKMSEVVDKESRSENPTYGMAFISELIRNSRYGGLLLMDTHLQINKDSVKVKLLPESPTDSRYDTRDLQFDLGDYSFREFGVGRRKITIGERVFYSIKLGTTDYNHIGLSGHFLQMPQFKISQEAFDHAVSVDPKLVREAVDYDNLSLAEEKEPKKAPTTESFAELKKMFNPETDITRFVPKKDGKFYHRISSKVLSKEEMNKRFRASTKPDQTNGFEIRVGDTIQIYGDTTHTYRISWVNFDKKRFEYDMKDGKEVADLKKDKYIPFDAVSAIVGREYPYKMSLASDYYQSDGWEELVKKHKYTRSKRSKVVSMLNFSDSDIEGLLGRYPTLLLYAVTNDDETVLTPLIDADGVLQDGFDTTSVGVYPATTVEQVRDRISDLEGTPNINGIVVVGLFGDGITRFSTNRKEFLSGITENYIQKYISFTSDPKYTEAVKPKEEKTKKKEKTESIQDKTLKVIETHKSREGLKEKLQEFISADAIEELKGFTHSPKWYVYYEDGKWYVFPTLEGLQSLSEEARNAILLQSPTVDLNKGDVITTKKKDSQETYDIIIKDYNPETKEYSVQYTINGVTYPSTRSKEVIEFLWGITYHRNGQVPIETIEDIETKDDTKEVNEEPKQPEQQDIIFDSQTAGDIMNRFYKNDPIALQEFITTSQSLVTRLADLNLSAEKIQQQLAEYINLGADRHYPDLRQLWSVSSEEDLNSLEQIIRHMNDPLTQALYADIQDMFEDDMTPKECN